MIVVERNRIELDHCTNCGGVWFDSHELELLLASFGESSKAAEPATLKVSQGTLADMIGTTRSRVSFFRNRFRKMGLIDYNGSLHVHRTLLVFLRQV